MTERDTQLPRYQVFHQEDLDRPHVNSGSVHAADAELALQNARDVFVRRPDCVSLWVARVGDIHSLTAEELESADLPKSPDPDESPETYQVFLKNSHIGSHEHAGSVQASSAAGALAVAIDEFAGEEVLVWWVVPDALISRTEPDDIDSLFQSAASKLYRDQAFYHTVTLMRRLREEKGDRT